MAPESSLLLVKASGRAPHGGGKRLAIGLARIPDPAGLGPRRAPPSIAARPTARPATSGVEPGGEIHLGEPGPRQLRVVARYADGHLRDVTRLASFKLNDDNSASVTPQGAVALLRRAETDVIVRYESHVLTTRLSTVINPDLAFDYSKLKRRNFIDDELFKRLEALKCARQPAGERRRVPPPRLARPDRRAAVARRGPRVPRRQGPREADEAGRPPAQAARVRPVLADQAGRPAPDQHRPAGDGAPRYQTWIDQSAGDEPAVGRGRPDAR